MAMMGTSGDRDSWLHPGKDTQLSLEGRGWGQSVDLFVSRGLKPIRAWYPVPVTKKIFRIW
jgi:hypothetical protein